MKKNYNQPNVEVASVMATSLMQAGSPAGIIGGGNTSAIPGNDPVGGD